MTFKGKKNNLKVQKNYFCARTKNEYMKLAKSKSFANSWIKLFDEQIKSVINS
jgi:hypothetical protein